MKFKTKSKSNPTQRKVKRVNAWAVVDQFGDIESVSGYQLKTLEQLGFANDKRPLGNFKILPVIVTYQLPVTKKR